MHVRANLPEVGEKIATSKGGGGVRCGCKYSPKGEQQGTGTESQGERDYVRLKSRLRCARSTNACILWCGVCRSALLILP